MRVSFPMSAAVQTQPDVTVDPDAFVREHIPQVKRLAYRLRNRLPACFELNDLVSEGLLGLLDAVHKFNPDRGVTLKTYAEYRIRGAMLDSLRKQDCVSRSVRSESRRIANARDELESLLGRSPSEEEVAEMADLSIERCRTITEKMAGMEFSSLSDDALSGDRDGDQRPIKQICAGTMDPYANLFKAEVRDRLTVLLDGLGKQEKLVISLYYYDGLTMKEISRILNVDESRISQIHTQAMVKLRTKLSGLRNLRWDS
jgi:RNA polymerase sigma factor FliA